MKVESNSGFAGDPWYVFDPRARLQRGAVVQQLAVSNVQKILVAIDFSPVSEAVVAHAASLAKAFSAELTLIHVAAPDPDFVGYEAGPQTVRDSRAETLHTEHRELQATAELLRQHGIATHALLIQGPTVEKILEEALRINADTIVLGSRGHGALYRALLGSVSEGVLRAAPCPLVVVPAPRPEAGESPHLAKKAASRE